MNGFPKIESNTNMKIKMKQIFCAVMATATISAMAATPSAPPASTNSKPADVVAQLLGSDDVVAKGKGFEIKRSQLDEVMDGLKASAAARGQAIPPEQLSFYEGRFLDRLVQIQLLLQKSTDADKAEGQKKTQAQIDDLKQRAGSQEKFEQQLKLGHMTEADLTAKMSQEVTAMVTLQREVGATASDAEAQAYFTNNPADFEEPEQVHARHILFLTQDPDTRLPVSDDKKKAKRQLAEDVLKRARNGEDFAKLAEQYSEDPGSKTQGGDLPPFGKDGMIAGGQGQMVAPFTAAAFSLTNNQISDIVETDYGYHIIQLLDKTPAKKLTLADKIPDTTETVGDRLKEVLAQQKMQTLVPPYLEKLEKDGNVEILDADLKAAIAAIKTASAANAPTMTPTAPAK
jgi:peptidyl-prolyl cis-trans isomerase C